MKEIDDLTPDTVQSGPLKAVLSRMTHRNNLDMSLKPNFTNDHIVSNDKIHFVQDLLSARENAINESYDDSDERRIKQLADIASLAMFLKQGNVGPFDTGESPAQKQKTVLRVASDVAKEYSRQKVGDIESVTSVGDNLQKINIDLDDSLRSKEWLDFSERYQSLHSTIVDLYQDGRFGYNGKWYAPGLLVLFDQVQPESPSEKLNQVLVATRRRLRSHVDMSLELNSTRKSDLDLRAGKTLLRPMIKSNNLDVSQGGNQYASIRSLEVKLMIENHTLNPVSARTYIEKHIAFILDTLYPSEQ